MRAWPTTGVQETFGGWISEWNVPSPTALPSLSFTEIFRTSIRPGVPSPFAYRQTLHPSKFNSWLCEVLNSRWNWSDTFSLVPPRTLPQNSTITRSSSACDCLLYPLLPQPSKPRLASLIGSMVWTRHVLMWGGNLRRQQTISPWGGAPVSSLVCLLLDFYPKEKLLCLYSYRTIGSLTYGFIISVANFI